MGDPLPLMVGEALGQGLALREGLVVAVELGQGVLDVQAE